MTLPGGEKSLIVSLGIPSLDTLEAAMGGPLPFGAWGFRGDEFEGWNQ